MKPRMPLSRDCERGSAAAPYPPRDHTAPFILFLNNDGAATVTIAVFPIAPVTAFAPSFSSTFLIGSRTILFAPLTPIFPTVVAVAVGVTDPDFGATVPVYVELNLGLGHGRSG